MKKVTEIISFVIENAPKIKYYAELVIHTIDMLDGVQDWKDKNKPETVKKKK